ncbi:hypothetical protein [Amycolatopsis coloradensis]|uniref:hypothetical protein n=1 Tax=Amycolatopsis coloradensis TaxID=76021 RepID=UPI00117873C6|nr:hypothetical protein [Amycolatopsis coloradensis]
MSDISRRRGTQRADHLRAVHRMGGLNRSRQHAWFRVRTACAAHMALVLLLLAAVNSIATIFTEFNVNLFDASVEAGATAST